MLVNRPANADKRRYIRYELLEYARIHSPALLTPENVVIVNIGLGGLQLRGRSVLPVNERCEVEVGLIDRAPIRLPGEIRHSVVYDDSSLVASGVRFMPKTHEERLTIAEFVHSVFQRQCDLLTAEND